MEKIKSYKDLVVWQKAHTDSLEIIELVEDFKWCRSLGVIGKQLIRSITSVGANIAEGYGSFQGKEYLTFLVFALRSAWESDNWLTLLKDSTKLKDRFDVNLLESIQSRNMEVIRMLSAIIKKLRK
jgi:four helix bundle protein